MKGGMTVAEFTAQLRMIVLHTLSSGLLETAAMPLGQPEHAHRRAGQACKCDGDDQAWTPALTAAQQAHCATLQPSANSVQQCAPRPTPTDDEADALGAEVIAQAMLVRPRVMQVLQRYERITATEWQQLDRLTVDEKKEQLGTRLYHMVPKAGNVAAHLDAPESDDE